MKREVIKQLSRHFLQPAGGEQVTLHGDTGAEIIGCRRILSYSPERIVLQVGRRKLILNGRGMVCSSFTAGALWIRGRIRSVVHPGKEEDGGA